MHNIKLFYLFSLVAFVPSCLIAMEGPSKNALIRRTESLEAIHSNEYQKLQALKSVIPNPPPLPIKHKKVTPPLPQQPSFIERNKRALIWGGIGAGTLIAAGVAWHMTQNNQPVHYSRYGHLRQNDG